MVHLSLLYAISKRQAWGAFLAIAVTATPSEGEEEDMDPTIVTLPDELRTPYTDDDNRGQVFTAGTVHAAIEATTMTTGELEAAIEKRRSPPQPEEPNDAELSDDFYRVVGEDEMHDERDRDGRLDTRARREEMGRYLPLGPHGLQLPIGPARRKYDTAAVLQMRQGLPHLWPCPQRTRDVALGGRDGRDTSQSTHTGTPSLQMD